MRNVLRNTHECAHFWAHQTQASGRAAALSFNGPILYSYGATIARLMVDASGRTIAVFSGRRYSVTTSKHMGQARGAASHLTARFVPGVLGTYDTPEAMSDQWASQISYLARYAGEATRAPSRVKRHSELCAAIRTANNLCTSFGLPLFTMPETPTDVAAYVERSQAEQAERAARQAETRAAREAARLDDARGRLAAWLNGEDVSTVDFSLLSQTEGASMRLRPGDPSTVETTMHADVPAEHVRRVAPLVLRVARSGKGWKRNGKEIRFGVYRVDEIREDGALVAGCHTFTRAELERFAAVLGVDGAEAGADA